jgi:hypothetical protein
MSSFKPETINGELLVMNLINYEKLDVQQRMYKLPAVSNAAASISQT